MSVIYLGVGQCGNQILGTYLSNNLQKNRNLPFLADEIKQFRSVLIDSEPKSCKSILKHSCMRNHLRKSNIIFGRKGRGSNWAYGYWDDQSGDDLLERSLEAVRKEAERIEFCTGLCLVHSLAGGTGSGFGLRLLQEIQDEVKLQLRLTFSVVPYKCGESPLQVYNYLLCLAGLISSADTINLLQNDWIHAQLGVQSSLSAEPSNMERFSTDICVRDMNNLIAEQMTNLLTPTTSLSGSDSDCKGFNLEPFELSRNLSCLPEAKLVRCISTGLDRNTGSKSDWSNLVDELEPTLRRCPIDATWNLNKPGAQTGCRPLGTLAALLVYRTNNKNSLLEATSLIPRREGRWVIDQSTSVLGSKLSHCLRPLSWNDAPLEQWFDSNSVNSAKSLTLAFNSCCITEDLECLVYRATMKRKVKAYLHWYTKYGCEESDFDQATEQIKHTIEGYNTLGK